MSLTLRVGAVLSLFLLGGALAVLWQQLSAPPVPRVPAAPGGRAAPAAPARTGGEAAAPASAPPASARPAAAPRPLPPRFDIVRVGARGTAVVAGRAPPGSEVILMEGGRELGRARADGRGEWVILPSEPVAPGARELSLRARLTEGGEIEGEDTAIVVVPDPAAPRLAARPDGVAPPAPAAAGTGRSAPGAAPETVPGSARDAATGAVARDGAAAAAEPDAAGPLALALPPTRSATPPRSLQGGSAGREARLSVGSVDYDDEGQMRFAGTAPPGSRLRLYADDRHLGDAVADPEGGWSLTPDPAPPPGRHTLRVDQLAARVGGGGAVLPVAGRVEVPFLREHLPPGALEAGRVVVQPGQSLWRLARQSYGRGHRYTVIYAANRDQIRDPARIRPGQVLTLPSDDADRAPSSPAAASRSR